MPRDLVARAWRNLREAVRKGVLFQDLVILLDES